MTRVAILTVTPGLFALFASSFAKPAVQLLKGVSSIPARDPALHSLTWPPPAPYDNIAKDLGAAAAASTAACEAACIAYRNTTVSPVSGWTRCTSFTHVPGVSATRHMRKQPSRCIAVVDASEWSPSPLDGAAAGRVTWPPQPCFSDADCSFNGACNTTSTLCDCDVAWTGDRCQSLALEPTLPDAGLRLTSAAGKNISSWGGAVLIDLGESDTGPMFHMWASEMEAGCGIDTWRSNSRIVHATSTDGVHFSREGVVFERFAHEPTVERAPSGEWVMWYTGEVEGASPPPLCTQCSDGVTPANTSCGTGAGASGPTYLSWAHSPWGPWSTPQRLFAAQSNETNMDTNLAATILADGSVVGIGRTGGAPTGILAHLVTARHWRDPSSYVGRWQQLLFPDTARLPFAGVEDPFVWYDRARRVFHAVFHNQIEGDDERLCGGHAFSADGEHWTFGGTAWSNRVHFRNHTYRFSRRERPHLLLDGHGAIVALTTAVQFGAHAPTYRKGEDACYTLLQPVRRKHMREAVARPRAERQTSHERRK